EMLVEELRDLLVLERFVLHDVAPVARRVADGEEDRLVLLLGLGKGLRTPGVPVHRVVGMLQEVGTLLLGESVRVAVLHFLLVDGFVLGGGLLPDAPEGQQEKGPPSLHEGHPSTADPPDQGDSDRQFVTETTRPRPPDPKRSDYGG